MLTGSVRTMDRNRVSKAILGLRRHGSLSTSLGKMISITRDKTAIYPRAVNCPRAYPANDNCKTAFWRLKHSAKFCRSNRPHRVKPSDFNQLIADRPCGERLATRTNNISAANVSWATRFFSRAQRDKYRQADRRQPLLYAYAGRR